MSGSFLIIPLFLVVYINLNQAAKHPHKITKLSYSPTEIFYIEDGYPKQRTYRLEDFFWTGSGDGAPEYPEEPWAESERIPTTIYRTKTVMSTVYISIMTVDNQNNSIETSTEDCAAISCETVTVPDGVEISPTPTFTDDGTSTVPATPVTPATNTTDRQFWLLTIIRTNSSEPVVTVLEKRLAKLYTVAFKRQQDRHLGISKRKKRNPKPLGANKPVNVHIYNISKHHNNNEIEVVYHVLVSGYPVAATTAASDMRLVSDEEVSAELGYPVLTKAEPYLKTNKPQGLAKIRDTWLIVGVAITAILLLLLTVSFFTLCLKKKYPALNRPSGIANRQKVFEYETGGEHHHEGFVEKNGEGKTYQSGKRHKKQPFKNTDTLSGQYKKGMSISSPSNSSITSSDSSSLSSSVVLTPKQNINRKRHKHPSVGMKRPAALNKALIQKQSPIVLDTDSGESGTDRRDSETGLIKNISGRVSPKSYLSMPSVKSFPRSSIPETLNRVLEPVSVLHLDVMDDIVVDSSVSNLIGGRKEQPVLARHASMGDEDPGVIGPVVWDMHCKRMQQDSSIDEPNEIKNISRMRRRFNDLLDDTFSLFGSSRDSPDLNKRNFSETTRYIDNRGHSATNIRLLAENQGLTRPRPKTSDSRRIAPSPGVDPPKLGAWGSGLTSPLVRPLSAGPFHRPQVTDTPKIDMERILADSHLPPNDPAIPLIAAIKTELQKCSLPGSTTNLAE